MTNIAIMGYGVVGQGVANVIYDNADIISKKIGDEINIKYILDLLDFPNDRNSKKIIHDFNVILNDDEISIVCEVMGGKGAAYKFTKALLEAGKSVVSSNKELVATYGDELIKIANEKGVKYLFEASVGGGIPVLSPIMEYLCANRIESICGIVNGTSNYILTEMKYGKDFATALAEAQKKGYAEANPTADVEGIDACRKICILAALAYGVLVRPEDVKTTGISSITVEDMANAEKENCVIKLIARCCRLKNGKINLSVAPMKVKKNNPLSGIDGVFNGILVNGNEVGDVMFYGPGAGSRPTASAVVGDVIQIAMHGNTQHKMTEWNRNNEIFQSEITDPDDIELLNNTLGYYLY